MEPPQPRTIEGVKQQQSDDAMRSQKRKTETKNQSSNTKYSHMNYLDACKIWFHPDGERAAKELKGLPLEEREQVWADLTGREATTTYKQNVVEDPYEIKSKLHELQSTLLKETNGSTAFQLVQNSYPDYMTSTSFLLKFLRASSYKTEIAASRIVHQHFEMKLELFGIECLGRNIVLSDLDDQIMMQSASCCQPLPGTDVGGRAVVVDRPGLMNGQDISRKSLFQWIWYLRMALAEKESVQKLGFVNVIYCLDEYTRQDLEAIRQFHSCLGPAIPIKIAARYAVYEDKAWKQVLDFEQVIMKQPARMRFRSIGGKLVVWLMWRYLHISRN